MPMKARVETLDRQFSHAILDGPVGSGPAPAAIGGVHHLALVCADMDRTVAFYRDVLGLALVKTIELPAGMGQHFFFDLGGGACLAFFWFPGAPAAVPGISAPAARPDTGRLVSAVGSMNHVALTVDHDDLSLWRSHLAAHGVATSEIVYHDDSEATVAATHTPDAFLASLYFNDPDGILLELAAWTRPLTAADVRHVPARAVPGCAIRAGGTQP